MTAASSTRVFTPSASAASGAAWTATSPVGDEHPERVGDVELALRVVRLEPLEQRPEQPRAKT